VKVGNGQARARVDDKGLNVESTQGRQLLRDHEALVLPPVDDRVDLCVLLVVVVVGNGQVRRASMLEELKVDRSLKQASKQTCNRKGLSELCWAKDAAKILTMVLRSWSTANRPVSVSSLKTTELASKRAGLPPMKTAAARYCSPAIWKASKSRTTPREMVWCARKV
jgi:hypothetical protein